MGMRREKSKQTREEVVKSNQMTALTFQTEWKTSDIVTNGSPKIPDRVEDIRHRNK